MPLPAPPLLSFLRGRIGLALVAGLGIGLTLAITGYLHREHQRLIATEIERRVSLRHDLLRQTLQDYEAALFALRLLVQHSEDLTPDEFARAASESAARVPGIQAVQWVPLLRAHELPAFVRRARELVGPDFFPRLRDASGRLAPLLLPPAPESPSDREHALITYIHPRAENEAALAYDILSAPTAPDLALARQNPGGLVLSRSFDLAQGGEGVVFLSYVERGSPASHPPPLGGPGFVQLVLRLETALGQAWNSIPNSILDVMLVDTTAGHTHVFSQVGDTRYPADAPPTEAAFPTDGAITRELVLGGRHWRAYYRPRPGWIEARRSSAPLFSLVGSSLLTLLSLAYVNTLRRRTARIAHEVRSRTAELAESRAMLDEIIDHNPGVIWVKDATLRYQLVNLRFCSAYRLSRPEILGKSDHGLHADPVVEAMEAVDRRVLATGETVSFEESYDMPDRRRTYLVSKFPLRAPDGSIRAVSGIATDITELREAESGRRAIERKLLENQKLESLVILAGGVAHDFNNLLTGILGHANLLRALLPEADAAQNSVAQIEIASHRAAALCRQMLAYSGRGRLAVRPIDPGQIAREAAEFLQLSVARQARIHYQLAPGLPTVTADPDQIRQLAMNLLINAAEALPEGRGDITLATRSLHADAALFARCVLAPELPAGTYVCLEIADRGCGMPPDLLARVFDPFFTTKFTGRGLGLAAVLGIVRGHLGALEVRSRPGEGSSFRIYLPASSSPGPAAPSLPAPTAGSSPPPARRLRLLLADDEDSVREAIRPLLSARGHHVAAYADGEEALRRFLAAPRDFDLVILDLTMPGQGGAEILRHLRLARPDTPVLLISGYHAEKGVDELLRAPATAFLPKPFTLEELIGKIDALAGT